MKKQKVVVLVHEDLVPPETREGFDPDVNQPWETEFDVSHALQRLGHDVHVLGVSDDLQPLRQLCRGWEPTVVFNLMIELQDIGAYEVHVASYLELLNVPYTGCNSRGLMLSRSKPLSKKIFRYHRIPTPGFVEIERGRKVRLTRKLKYPLIVKSAEEDASLGVYQASVVYDAEDLVERVEFVHRSVGTDAMAEEYVEGREITVGVLGNERLTTLPIWEMSFENLPESAENIATAKAKWNREYQKKIGVKTGPAKLSKKLARRIARLARRAYRCLDMSGYARLDLRVTEDERIYFIEANPNPDLTDDEDFALAAARSGVKYDALIQRIVKLGLDYRAPWKGEEEE